VVPAGAVIIDTSARTIEEVVEKIVEMVRNHESNG
jgi:cytidylate kinase